MTPTTLNPIKRPLLIGISSVIGAIVTGMLWLRFPSLLTLGVFIVVGFAGAATFLVCETIVVLRVAKVFVPPGGMTAGIRNPPLRSLVVLGVLLVLGNGVLVYLTDLRPRSVWAAAVSAAVVVSWALSRRAARPRNEETHDHSDT